MFRHRSKLLLVLVVLIAAVGGAWAASQPFYAMVGNETPEAEGSVWVRYYTTATDRINPIGDTACKGTWDPPFCEVPHTNKPSKNKVGYLGYLEDIFNFDGQEGNVYHAVWDTEFGSGTSEHRGYYTWSAREVYVGERSTTWVPSCEGDRDPNTCLGNSDSDFGTGHDIEDTGLGTLHPQGGLLPMPVPVAVRTVEEGVLEIEWEAADGTGLAGKPPWEAEYELYYVVTGNSCRLPTADEFEPLKHVQGTRTTVRYDEVGIEWGAWDHFFLALKIVFPSADGRLVESRYLSADSTCMEFWGDAAEVVNLRARWLRRNLVEVSWETQLEENVRGFYVLRSFTERGPWERVSDLVPANGEPSKYSYLDAVTAEGRLAGSGLYYKIEAIEYDETATDFGPVRAEAPDVPRPWAVERP